MKIKRSYKLFFAIPFDCETKSIYDDIIKKLHNKYGSGKLTCVVGNKQIGPSRSHDRIETFKMQNSELFMHFVKQIRYANIVIVDLTDNNPNVHVELGIALFYNKNILRVTRHSYEKLAFDVRNYEVSQYKKQGELFNTIEKYLNIYFKIKDLDFKKQNSPLHYYSPKKKHLKCWKNEDEKKNTNGKLARGMTEFQMRDGKVSVTFKITDQKKNDDWFGIYLRVGSMGPFHRSCLVYIRKNGKIEIATYPGPKTVKEAQLHEKSILGDKTLVVELDGNWIRASVDDVQLEHSLLDVQSQGEVMFACWNSNAEFWNTQIVCRDTIETFDKF
ncbi:hypothetical protein ACFL1F_01065 [Chlamydiota bacterium]